MTFNEFICEWESSSPMIVAHTSGSTGQPKEIWLDKEFVRASALRTNSFFRITSGSRLHSCVSPDFIGGKMMAVRACEAGCRLTWENPSNRPLSEIGENESIDLLAVVPSQMLHILDCRENRPEIKSIIIGGSAIDMNLRRRIIESGLDAYETYGMTESASHIALRKVSENAEWFETLPGIEVELDGRGCLVIQFHSGERLVTNDMATLKSPFGFKIDGRYDHVIITGGRKVNPFSLEEKIAAFLSRPYVVTSLPDEKWGRRVALKIEGGRDEEMAGMLEKKMRESLEPWERPKEIIFVKCLERTVNGKLKR